MSGFQTFVTAFCTVCVLLGGLFLLCPSGNLAKPVKYVFCLVFLLCVLTSALGLKRVQLDYKSSAQPLQAADGMGVAAAEYAFRLALTNEGIQFSKITVCTDKSDDGSIIITKVIVCSSDSAQKIRQVLGENAGHYEVEIVNE